MAQMLAEQGLQLKRQCEAQQAQRESEEKLRLVFEQSLDAIFITMPDGTIINANPAACRMFGRAENELCSLGRGGIIDSLDPRLPAALEERRRKGRIETELTCIRGNGARFPAEVRSVITGSGSDPSFVIVRDISERKQAEELLRKSEEKFSKAFKASPEAISIASLDDGKYFEVNDQFLEITGYRREELIGHTSSELNFWIDEEDYLP